MPSMISKEDQKLIEDISRDRSLMHAEGDPKRERCMFILGTTDGSKSISRLPGCKAIGGGMDGKLLYHNRECTYVSYIARDGVREHYRRVLGTSGDGSLDTYVLDSQVKQDKLVGLDAEIARLTAKKEEIERTHR
jgi:hypothetical protein